MRWVVVDPEVSHGKPVFKGTRVLVSDVLELLAAGYTVDDVLREFPSLNRRMINEAMPS